MAFRNTNDILLVYEQEDVQLLDATDDDAHVGKLRIVEKEDECAFVEWSQSFDDSDSEWAVIDNSPTKEFSSESRKIVLPISYEVNSIYQCRVTDGKKKLELYDKNNEAIAAFIFHSQHSGFFFDVLERYVTSRPSERDSTTYLLQNKRQADIDDKLAALDLVPTRDYNSRLQHHHWAAEAPKKVWGFFNNMKKDPYNTTLTTLSKVYDVVLYGDPESITSGREDDTEVAELLHCISGMDDLEPGFEILTKKEQLANRESVERINNITHEEFKTFVDTEGKIMQVETLKERIFRGGIHPNLRSELWCYLLGYYEWNFTYSEREEWKKKKEKEYYAMKEQWKTITPEQEMNFSGYRDRKSIIEKDVNRTDRNHPFYEGEGNSNLVILNDVLMTFIMYNFDLGYVQGMSDLLAPILYVTHDEPTAFWCFVGYMNRVYRNFDLDQSGMKQQLSDLTQLIRIVDPEFYSFLEAQESANLYFCFRWLLVRFKRELNYSDTLSLWEVLWTDHLCTNFHLCIAVAILDTERSEIVAKKFGFTDVLKHINGLSLHIDLDCILKKAEAIYRQLSDSPAVPNTVRLILNLPQIEKLLPKSTSTDYISPTHGGVPGRATRISPTENTTNNSGSFATATVRFSPSNEEKMVEDGITFSYM